MAFTLGSVTGKLVRHGTLIAALVLALVGCQSTPDDETAGWDAQKLYSEAKSLMNEGGYDQAIKLLEKLEARYPYGRYAQQAQLDIAYAYYKSGEPDLSILAADRFIKLHPNHSDVDYAYYLKGLANFNEDIGVLGNVINKDLTQRDPRASLEAFDAFRELAERFPNSKYVADARLRMQYLVNSLASHEIHVARYYYRRGAYVATVNRAQAVIAQYPNAPSHEEALLLLVTSYDKLGLSTLRDDAERVMRRNFPNSKYFSKGTTEWWKHWD
ncbi:MAG: outer membrane protein assembly factor BamD [Azoarcus sp.]|jgi:outer membrane protein assembly factor BamD|nr:outer membrane protein assembly factor BamD [Azoarcus sp.]